MTRLTAAVVAGAAFLLWMDVGSAQQPSSQLRIAATTVNDLRTWDRSLTAGLRTGDLQVTSLEQDPSLPSRVVERMQQFYQGVPVLERKSSAIRSPALRSRSSAKCLEIFSMDTQPALDAAAAERAMMTAAGAGARLARRMELTILPMTEGAPRLAYSAIVATSDNVFRLFVMRTRALSCCASRRFTHSRRWAPDRGWSAEPRSCRCGVRPPGSSPTTACGRHCSPRMTCVVISTAR